MTPPLGAPFSVPFMGFSCSLRSAAFLAADASDKGSAKGELNIGGGGWGALKAGFGGDKGPALKVGCGDTDFVALKCGRGDKAGDFWKVVGEVCSGGGGATGAGAGACWTG